MPDQVKTIGATGDYATIAAWEADSDILTGFWRGELIDPDEYAGGVTFSGSNGTPSSTNYVWLDVAPNVRHSGKSGTGHARVRSSSTGAHVFIIGEQYVRIENIEIRQDSTGASDEGIRLLNGSDNALISRCIIWTNRNVSDQDGIYSGNSAINVSVDNCVIYGWRRAGIHAQNHSSFSASTQNWNIDFCTISNCGDANEFESGAVNSRTGYSGSINNLNIYNTAGLATRSSFDDFSVFSTAGTTNWAGTNNASSDGSLTARGFAVDGWENVTLIDTSQSSGSFFVVNDLTMNFSADDYQLLDDNAGNIAYGNGVDRVGSEPDSRQDFSLDIVGNLRSTLGPAPDIGASEYISASSVTVSIPGISISGNTGTISVSGATAAPVAGVFAIGGAGSLVVLSSAALSISGVGSSGNVGALTVAASSVVAVDGNLSEGQPGVVAVSLSGDVVVPLVGVTSSGEAGSVSASAGAVANVSGVDSVGQTGSVLAVVGQTVVISGVDADGQVGIITIDGGIEVLVSGVIAVPGVGSVAVPMPAGIVYLDGVISIAPTQDGVISFSPIFDGSVSIN